MICRKWSVTLASLIALTLGASSGARAGIELVKNGSFENSQFGGKSTQLSNSNFTAPGVTAGTSGLDNWNSAGGNTYNLWWNSANAKTVDAISQYPSQQQRLDSAFTGASPDGGYFVGLDGDKNVRGALSQSISGLTAGGKYQLSFYWAAVQLSNRTGATDEVLRVSLGTETFDTDKLSILSQGFSGWKKVNYTFTASGTTETLSFLSIGNPEGLPPMALLDGVSLQAVPEPSTLSLMAIASVGVGAVVMRRRAKPAVA